MEVVWSNLAVESLYDILAYIQISFGKRTANSVALKIISFVESLGSSPYIGKRIPDLSDSENIRCAFYKQNHIYYQISDNQIEIILIWDGRQNPANLQKLLINFLINK